MSGVDALAWVQQSRAESGDRYEVHQVWGDLLIDVRQVEAGREVVIGSSTGFRWQLLGVDMGWLPAVAARILPPLWTDAVATHRADFEVPNVDLPGARDHVLVADGHVRVADGWDGFVERDGQRTSFAEAEGSRCIEGGLEVPLHPSSRVVVEVAGQVFQLQRSRAAKRAVARFSVDPGLVGVTGFVGAFFAAVMAAAPGSAISTVAIPLPDAIVNVAELVPAPLPTARSDAGPKAKDDEGRTGKRDASQREARGGGRKVRPILDREIAEGAGLLSASTGRPGLSAELMAGVGGLIGARGSRIGSGGLGHRGPGLGAGGEADAMGGLGLSGTGERGGPDLGRKSEGAIESGGRETVLIGNLDKSLIEEVIRRNLNQIRYCYQRELSRDPDLGGKVVVKFTIGGDGEVTSAATKTSSLGNSTVESCIAGRFLRMDFPAPANGGLAIVSYPFVFSPG